MWNPFKRGKSKFVLAQEAADKRLKTIILNNAAVKKHVDQGFEEINDNLENLYGALEELKKDFRGAVTLASPQDALQHPLIQEIRKKGMSGMPVVCKCGDTYGDFWGFCKTCGRRTVELPEDCFPLGRSKEQVIYTAPKKRKN